MNTDSVSEFSYPDLSDHIVIQPYMFEPLQHSQQSDASSGSGEESEEVDIKCSGNTEW